MLKWSGKRLTLLTPPSPSRAPSTPLAPRARHTHQRYYYIPGLHTSRISSVPGILFHNDVNSTEVVLILATMTPFPVTMEVMDWIFPVLVLLMMATYSSDDYAKWDLNYLSQMSRLPPKMPHLRSWIICTLFLMKSLRLTQSLANETNLSLVKHEEAKYY